MCRHSPVTDLRVLEQGSGHRSVFPEKSSSELIISFSFGAYFALCSCQVMSIALASVASMPPFDDRELMNTPWEATPQIMPPVAASGLWAASCAFCRDHLQVPSQHIAAPLLSEGPSAQHDHVWPPPHHLAHLTSDVKLLHFLAAPW